MNSRVRIRWDRVCILAAIVMVVIIAIVNAVAKLVDGPDGPDGSEVAAAPAAAPAAPVARPCPEVAEDPVLTAPHKDGERTVALTFDDGPGRLTDDILAVLAQEGVKATFFVVGREAAAAPDQVREMYAAGHAVENHSWSHPSAKRGRWSPELIGKQIRQTSEKITEITGQPPCFFRPPQGVVPGSEKEAQSAGLAIALWSVDTRDWALGSGPKAAETIRARARRGLDEPNPVVLLHDSGGNRAATLKALAGIIADYRERGYVFVTLGDGRV
jgi:peptidoglycan-N-acetylglucosamine deacetylase